MSSLVKKCCRLEVEENDFSNMKGIIDKALASKELEQGRNEVKAECWNYEGESARRTVDFLSSSIFYE